MDSVRRDYYSCIGDIPLMSGVVVDSKKLRNILEWVLENDVSRDGLVDLLREAVYIEDDSYCKPYYKAYEDYLLLLAIAILDCKEYALRYEKCKKLERSGAPPDEVEICYEAADKMRKPVFL